MSLLIFFACLAIIVGLIGCVVPGIAGPPFSFLGLILLSIARKWESFSSDFLILMAVLAAVTAAMDYIFPAIGARKFGSSRFGFWGAIIGLFIGMFTFPPFGIIIGAFLGAIAGELYSGKQIDKALRAGWGVFAGILMGMVLKLVVSGIMTFYFVKALV
ncbi:DUF456 domain-containing protein [Acidobacteriota bacterium]